MNFKFIEYCYRGIIGFILVVSFHSCEKENKIDPSDSNALQSVLVVPGGQLVPGNPPSPTTTAGSPTINSTQSSGSIQSGNQLQVPFGFNSTSGYNNCYVQVRGASNGYFNIPANNNANNGTITIPIQVPSSVASGSFCVQYCIADSRGRVSNVREYCVDVSSPSGSGGTVSNGKGSFTINGKTYQGTCISIPSTMGNTGLLDVSIVANDGSSVIIYNVPSASSGTSNFVDFSTQTTKPWGVVTLSSPTQQYLFTTSATLTKKGAKQISFSGSVKDNFSTSATTSISGSGSY